jgi:lysophospholipase L1-like esterase
VNVFALLLSIVVLGDSVAHGAGDEANLGIAGRLGAVNLAVNGSRTTNVVQLLRAPHPSLRTASTVVVSIGGNDLYGDSMSRFMTTLWPAHAMNRTLDRVGAIVARIHRINPNARVILLGLYDPYAIRALDTQVALWDSRLIARFARDHRVQVIRIADLFAAHQRLSPRDHFHPSAAGYALIAARIAGAL